MAGTRPIVKAPKGKTREGRGFTRLEIKEAGLNIQNAREMRINIDKRRKTCRKENVELLKKIIESLDKEK